MEEQLEKIIAKLVQKELPQLVRSELSKQSAKSTDVQSSPQRQPPSVGIRIQHCQTTHGT